MVTKEQIDKHVAKARTYLGRATATQEESVIVAIADENDRLRADNAKLLATLEHSATHKALDALAKENATLRAQLAECMAQVERMRTRLEFLSKLKDTP